MCGYRTLQTPEFDEQDRLAEAPVEKAEDLLTENMKEKR
jgi:hypothetical protein